jgi:hypothetical protein
MEKRSVGFLFGMNMLMLGANLVWVAYNTILLPTLVEKVGTINKGFVVGLVGFFGTLLALLVSILWGISDHIPALGRTGNLDGRDRTAAVGLQPYAGTSAATWSLAVPIILISYAGMQFALT